VTTDHQVRSYGPVVSTDYEICIKGRLGTRWAAWFDGLAITDPGDGTTVLRGPVADQAALHGLLQRLRDVGLDLLWLREVSGGAPTTEGHRPAPEGT
jgi:hypothetical protein